MTPIDLPAASSHRGDRRQLSGVWRAFRGSRRRRRHCTRSQQGWRKCCTGRGIFVRFRECRDGGTAKDVMTSDVHGAKCRRSRSGCANEFANEITRDEEDVASDRRRSCALRPGQRRYTGTPETRKTSVVLLITQRRQVHNQDMTREYLHRTSRIPGTALQWVRDHLPKWRRRPPTAGVREPRRPKPSLPAAAVALKEPRVGLMHWIKLGSRRPGDQT